MVGVAGHVGGDAQEHLLADRGVGGDGVEAVELVVRVEHDVADAGRQGLAQLVLRLGVAVHVGAAGVEAAAQRQRQLAAGGDVAGQALLGEHAVDGGARERLGGEQDVEVVVAGRQRVDEGAGAAAQVVLHHDVAGGAVGRASSTASHPPSSRWPRSLTRVPRG